MSREDELRSAVGTPHRDDRPDAAGWTRLSPRLLLVNLGMLGGPLVLFLLALLVTGATLQTLISLGSLLITFLMISGIGTMRLATTRFRVADGRVELRSGLIFRVHRSAPLDRIRTVDVYAKPMHRLVGLASLRIGTGGQTSSTSRELSLDGITGHHASELRRLLLDRRGSSATNGPDQDATVAEMDWAWLRYAPLAVWGVGSVCIGVGSAYRVLHEMKIDPLELDGVKDVVEDRFASLPLWFGILLVIAIVVVAGAAVSTATFVEGWADYRLERDEGDVFRVHRGLLVSRSVTLEGRLLCGVEISEPMLLRWAGGARLDAVASGLGSSEENRSRRSLTPPAPREEALRVAADVLAEERSPTESTDLVRHPHAALRRRIVRGFVALAPVVAAQLGLGVWLAPVLVRSALISALIGLPVVIALANDAYHALGHGLCDRYLVVRAGTFTRRTTALQRDRVIGWKITRSAFQRRNDLLTLGAITAAGDGCYKVRDVPLGEGIALAEDVVPDLLGPFVERVPRG
ncbi:PH domain-containing protein [Streptomyces sp. NPDC059169]|uniref:PH domain-containing protein n=1 Tax=Streptomyces sp. NPDC059169 TaxID=3346754 RepID=UPI00368BC49A